MTSTALTAICTTGFTVAFFHAAIPTHWLPFVLTGRVQKWSRSKTLLVTALAGCGHVLFTAVLGFLVAWCGIALNDKVGGWFPWIAGGALIAFGLFYVVRQLRGKGHGHSHAFGGHSHGDHGHTHGETEHGPHGPNGGMLVDTWHGFVELTVFETGVPPRWQLFFYNPAKQPQPLPPAESVTIETVRPGDVRQTFAFVADGGFLESTDDIPQPHEFQAIVRLIIGGNTHEHEVRFIEDHDHGHETIAEELAQAHPPPRKSDWAAILSLFALLTFSPCEGFIPVYVSGVRYGWGGFFLLTAILSVGTVAGMIVFTWLTLAGIEKLKLAWLEKYESGVLGGLLVMLGIVVILFEH